MTNKPPTIKIVFGALQEKDDKIILRGVLDNTSLKDLRYDDYQREVIPLAKKARLAQGVASGAFTIPDITLGMRGQKFTSREGNFYCHDDVYIIDGLQRVSACLAHMQLNGGVSNVSLGCKLFFDTNYEMEEELFEILNSTSVRMSPNILLRNRARNHEFLGLLHNLCTEATNFPLHQRVQWNQNMARLELMPANAVFRIGASLHSHKVTGILGSRILEAIDASDRITENVGKNNVRANLFTYFNLIDQAWGIRRVQYKKMAPQLRGSFNFVLSKLFSDHVDFWRSDDKLLFISADHARKIASFPINDPSVASLTASGGKSKVLLYGMLKEHIDSGRRTHRLTKRRVCADIEDEMEPEFAE